nr:MAG TPA: hypothetical protein [Bacteriophage sp.]
MRLLLSYKHRSANRSHLHQENRVLLALPLISEQPIRTNLFAV